jgi:carnitine O-acetyltransferase
MHRVHLGYRQIQHIYDSTAEEYPGVGVLTASNRDIWAKVHLCLHILLAIAEQC